MHVKTPAKSFGLLGRTAQAKNDSFLHDRGNLVRQIAGRVIFFRDTDVTITQCTNGPVPEWVYLPQEEHRFSAEKDERWSKISWQFLETLPLSKTERGIVCDQLLPSLVLEANREKYWRDA